MVFNFLDEEIRFYVPSKVEDQTRPKTSDDNVRRYGPSLKKIMRNLVIFSLNKIKHFGGKSHFSN